MPKIVDVELFAHRTANAEQIVPLALGAFAAGAIPLEFAQNGIFRRRYRAFDRMSAIGQNLPEDTPREFHATVFFVAPWKEVEFPGGAELIATTMSMSRVVRGIPWNELAAEPPTM